MKIKFEFKYSANGSVNEPEIMTTIMAIDNDIGNAGKGRRDHANMANVPINPARMERPAKQTVINVYA